MLEEKIERLIIAVEALTEAIGKTPKATANPAENPAQAIAEADVKAKFAPLNEALDKVEKDLEPIDINEVKDKTLKMSRAGNGPAIKKQLGGKKLQDLSADELEDFYIWLDELEAEK